jgi:hypothetical protein
MRERTRQSSAWPAERRSGRGSGGGRTGGQARRRRRRRGISSNVVVCGGRGGRASLMFGRLRPAARMTNQNAITQFARSRRRNEASAPSLCLVPPPPRPPASWPGQRRAATSQTDGRARAQVRRRAANKTDNYFGPIEPAASPAPLQSQAGPTIWPRQNGRGFVLGAALAIERRVRLCQPFGRQSS